MLRVPVIKNNLNKALKLFKRKFKNTQVIKELRERQSYTKKSRKKRLIKDKAIYKQKYLNNLDDGDELEIQIRPLSYRKWLNQNEGWIRITGTYIDMAWENNSYISNDNTIPVSANYWLYGDFVVNKNNTLQ